jgi:hypothetical protein
MKQEVASFSLISKAKFYRTRCDPCNAETIFRNHKCASCGAAKRSIYVPANKAQSFIKKMKVRYAISARNKDKAVYYKRMAEESRKKFENK